MVCGGGSGYLKWLWVVMVLVLWVVVVARL